MSLFNTKTNKKRKLIKPQSTKLPDVKRMLAGRKHRNWWWVVFVSVGIIIGVVILVIFDGDSWFTVRHIDCLYADMPCETAYYDAVSSLKGKPILKLDTINLERELLLNNPSIEKMEFTTRLPLTLAVTFYPREPVAIVQDANGYLYLTDENSLLFAYPEDEVLPLMRIQETVSLGQTLASTLDVWTLELLAKLKDSALDASEVTIYNRNHIEIVLRSKQTVLFTQSKDRQMQVDALQFILANATIEDGEIQHIDLRFENPVVK